MTDRRSVDEVFELLRQKDRDDYDGQLTMRSIDPSAIGGPETNLELVMKASDADDVPIGEASAGAFVYLMGKIAKGVAAAATSVPFVLARQFIDPIRTKALNAKFKASPKDELQAAIHARKKFDQFMRIADLVEQQARLAQQYGGRNSFAEVFRAKDIARYDVYFSHDFDIGSAVICMELTAQRSSKTYELSIDGRPFKGFYWLYSVAVWVTYSSNGSAASKTKPGRQLGNQKEFLSKILSFRTAGIDDRANKLTKDVQRAVGHPDAVDLNKQYAVWNFMQLPDYCFDGDDPFSPNRHKFEQWFGARFGEGSQVECMHSSLFRGQVDERELDQVSVELENEGDEDFTDDVPFGQKFDFCCDDSPDCVRARERARARRRMRAGMKADFIVFRKKKA